MNRLYRHLLPITCIVALSIADVASASEQRNPGPESAPVETIDAVVRAPRAFGYFVGDIVRQEVQLQGFEPAELPRTERAGVWFERRASRTYTSSDDGNKWLVLEYQIVNAPREARTIELPPLKIDDVSGTRALLVPSLPIGVAPLAPALPTDASLLAALRSDREAPHIATKPIVRRLIAYGAVCLLLVLSWGAWLAWRNWRARSQLPFARAWREVQHLDERTPEAWRALHRAFDRAAGRVTHSATLPALFETAPYLRSERSSIERFFAQSSEMFFGSGLPSDALSVRALCRDLRKLERQHER